MESMKPRPPSRGRGRKHKPRSRPTSRTAASRPEELKAAIERGRRLEGRFKETARELRTQAAGEGGLSTEEKVARIADTITDKLFENFDIEKIKEALAARSDPDPLKVVLLQEVELSLAPDGDDDGGELTVACLGVVDQGHVRDLLP